MDFTGSGCRVYIQSQVAELRKERSKGDSVLFILLFLLPSLSLPIFVFTIVRYAQALGIKDPFGVQGFAMALGRMRILIIKKKQKKNTMRSMNCSSTCSARACVAEGRMASIVSGPYLVLALVLVWWLGPLTSWLAVGQGAAGRGCGPLLALLFSSLPQI